MRLARIDTPAGPRPVVADGTDWAVVEDLFARPLVRTGERYPVEDAVLLAPVEPRVVLGMAHNSGPDDRALPPQAFLKSARSVVGPLEPIVVDPRRGRVFGEVELCLVVGRVSRDVAEADAADHLLGWTVINDVTAVDQVAVDEKMVQAKSGDGFTPIGPWVETELDALSAGLVANNGAGESVSSTTAGLAWNPFEVFAFLTGHLTLGPGDVIATGAPGTAFPIEPGDVCTCTVEGIGTLVNPVVALGAASGS